MTPSVFVSQPPLTPTSPPRNTLVAVLLSPVLKDLGLQNLPIKMQMPLAGLRPLFLICQQPKGIPKKEGCFHFLTV